MVTSDTFNDLINPDLNGKNIWNNWMMNIHKNDKYRVMKNFENCYSGKIDSYVEKYQVLHKKEKKHLWLSTETFVTKRNKEGEAIKLIGIIQDITKRERQEIQIQESQLFLSNATNKGNIVVWEWNINKDGIRTSDNYEKLTGINPQEEGIFSKWISKVHPEDLDSFNQELNKCINGESDYFYLEFRFQKPNDTGYFWFKGEGFINEVNSDGTPASVIGINQDITDLKTKEIELAQQKGFSELLTSISTDYINIDIKQVDNAINKAFQEIGTYLNVDRTYLFSCDKEKGIVTNTHEWCAPNVKAFMDENKTIPISILESYMDKYECGDFIIISDVNQLQKSPLKELLQSQDIKSLIIMPIYIKDELYGFCGFDIVKEPRVFEDWELSLFKVFTKVISNILEKRKVNIEKEFHIKRNYENLENILNSIPIGVALINRDNNKFLFMNDTVKEMFEIDDEIANFDGSSVYKNPTDLISVMDELERTGKVVNKELEVTTTKTNQVKWVETNIMRGLFLDKETTLICLYDITNNKDLELQIKQSYNQINAATRAANFGMWDWYAKDDLFVTNDTFELLLGYEPHTFPNTSIK